ncbi:MAG: CDP-glycerol glycerophosphotransferase family protein [Clostridia bacterium]|nr:CDP-glycerol glycerophosphotransferase family protein [Clostridia bacterium]
MDEMLRFGKKVAMRVLLFPLRLIPVKKNRVVMMNNLAKTYADNPKYVTEYLLEHYPGQFEIIFPVNDMEKHAYLTEKGITPVRFNSFKYFYYAMTAQVFLSNSGGFSYLPLRKKQFVVNTWHGGGAYKKCGVDMYNNTRLFRADLKMSAKQTDVFMSTCEAFTREVSRSMLVPREIFWGVGMPRNDMLLNNNQQKRAAIREKLGLAEDERLMLFAPTYRKPDDNYFKDSIAIDYGVDTGRVCAALETRFGGKWKFAFRYHPAVVNRGEFDQGNVLDLTDYPDMQELLVAADAMINDFSSSMWDFMLTGRPSFLFATDLEHYVATTEVYTPVSSWPFPQSTNNDDLERTILEFSEADYAAACRRHYEELGGCETGEAAKLICQRIYDTCFKK